MVARTDALPMTRQCEFQELSRSTFCHILNLVGNADLGMMRFIYQCHLRRPYYASGWARDRVGDSSQY